MSLFRSVFLQARKNRVLFGIIGSIPGDLLTELWRYCWIALLAFHPFFWLALSCTRGGRPYKIMSVVHLSAWDERRNVFDHDGSLVVAGFKY